MSAFMDTSSSRRAATRPYAEYRTQNRRRIIPEQRAVARSARRPFALVKIAVHLPGIDRDRPLSPPRPALALAPPVRLPRPGRRAGRRTATGRAPARAVRPPRSDRRAGRNQRPQRVARGQVEGRARTARPAPPAAAHAVPAVPVDGAVLPAQPRRHPELGAAGAAAPGRAGRGAPGAGVEPDPRRHGGRPAPEPRAAPARRPAHPGPASAGRGAEPAGQAGTDPREPGIAARQGPGPGAGARPRQPRAPGRLADPAGTVAQPRAERGAGGGARRLRRLPAVPAGRRDR